MITINDWLIDGHAIHYSLTEHLALHEITVHFKNAPFETKYSRKHKQFGIKICKFHDSKGYM
jgi:hypothetical protein